MQAFAGRPRCAESWDVGVVVAAWRHKCTGGDSMHPQKDSAVPRSRVKDVLSLQYFGSKTWFSKCHNQPSGSRAAARDLTPLAPEPG